MYCNKCGKEIDENDNYCKFCGAQVACDAELTKESVSADMLRFVIVLIITVAKWAAYFLLSLLVLLVIVPHFVEFDSDNKWYILGVLAFVALLPCYELYKHRRHLTLSYQTFQKLGDWLNKE